MGPFFIGKKLTYFKTSERNLIAFQKCLHKLGVLEKNTKRDKYTLGGLK